MSAAVKYISSTMVGAPTMSGVLGGLLAVLDAALVNGFNLVTVNSLVVAGGVATATVNASHNFIAGRVILLAGATPAGLNGEKRIIAVTSPTVFTFDATGIADQTATGTISAKVAPLGWERTSAASNVNYYRSLDPMSSRYGMFAHDNVTATRTYVGAYERLSAAGAGLSGFMGYGQWIKSITADATVRGWHLIGDSRGFYLLTNTRSAGVFSVYFFGDPISKKSGDIFGALITGVNASLISANTPMAGCLSTSDRVAAAGFMSRPLGSATSLQQTVMIVGAAHTGATSPALSGSTSYSLLSYPNTPDNSWMAGEVNVITGGMLRATMPGLYHCAQTAFSVPAPLLGKLAGRVLSYFNVGPAAGGASGGLYFDTTGPWR